MNQDLYQKSETWFCSTSITLSNKEKSQFDNAVDLYKAVEKSRNELFGTNHPITLKTKHNIARCLQGKGQLDDAINLYTAVEKIQNELEEPPKAELHRFAMARGSKHHPERAPK